MHQCLIALEYQPALHFILRCYIQHLLKFLGAFAKLREATISFVIYICLYVRLSVRLLGTIRFPLDGFKLNFTYEYLSKICRESSRFVKSDKNDAYFI